VLAHARKLLGVCSLIIQQSVKMAQGSAGRQVSSARSKADCIGRGWSAVIDTASRHVEPIQLTVVTDNEAARRLRRSGL
jgi:hypothetical protein